MKTIINHIEYLLSRNDCVIVPNFGAFLAHYQSAKFDQECTTITPPKRVFTFNSGITHNDGMLACSISRSQGIGYDQALDILYGDVQELQQFLHKNKELVLGRLGTLIYDSETDSTQFFPATTDQLSSFAFNLPVVKNDDTEIVNIPSEPEYIVGKYVSPWSRIARMAASIALLLLIGFVASTPIAVDDAALASLYPELRQCSIDEILPSQPTIIGTIKAFTSNSYPLTIDAESVLKDLDKLSHNYLIIVGSFANRDEAERFISQYPNYQLDIFEKDGRVRVYSESFNTENEAYKAVSSSPFAKQGAWVCKK